MIFSRSSRLIKAYKHCGHPYSGFGPVNADPTRLMVRGKLHTRRRLRFKFFDVYLPSTFRIMLIVNQQQKQKWTKHGKFK